MRYVLLTWNPGPNDDLIWTPDQFRDALVVPTGGGQPVRTSWSVGMQTAVSVGDRAFLYRQGECGRGIVAGGIIARGPEAGSHWVDPAKSANYVLIDWYDVLTVEERFDLDELEREIPEFNWRTVFFSGRVLPDQAGKLLAEAFSYRAGGELVGSPKLSGTATTGGQGFGTAEHNAAVEEAAMARTVHEWEHAGLRVIDVSSECVGWDLTALDGDGSEFHIEVKGTSGSARSSC